MQEGIVEVSGDQSVVVNHKEVGGSGLGRVAASCEQHLVNAVVGLGLESWSECHHVVRAALDRAELGSSSRRFGLNQQAQRANAASEIVADRAGEDVEQAGLAGRSSCADVLVGTKNRGAQVERTRLRRRVLHVCNGSVHEHGAQQIGIWNGQT